MVVSNAACRLTYKVEGPRGGKATVGEWCRAATYRRTKNILREQTGRRCETYVIGVYRSENETHVRRLIEPALAAGWRSAWWALDRVVAPLSAHTIGCGPGSKFELLNELIGRLPSDYEWLVVADDDVDFVRGSLVEFVAASSLAGFALAQPAHVTWSAHSHEITLSRAMAIARHTNFVEIGPVFAAGLECLEAIVPFPHDAGMGWGLELEWADLADRGCRLGIVDATTIVHGGRVGDRYDLEGEKRLLKQKLHERGIERWRDTHRTLATWRPWQRRPPWTKRSP